MLEILLSVLIGFVGISLILFILFSFASCVRGEYLICKIVTYCTLLLVFIAFCYACGSQWVDKFNLCP